MNKQNRANLIYLGVLTFIPFSVFALAGIRFQLPDSILPQPKIQREVFVATSATSVLGDGYYGRVRRNPGECKESISQDDLNSLLSQGVKVISSNTVSKNYQNGYSTYSCEGSSYIIEGPQRLLDEIRASGE
jgi:hypothetical protein